MKKIFFIVIFFFFTSVSNSYSNADIQKKCINLGFKKDSVEIAKCKLSLYLLNYAEEQRLSVYKPIKDTNDIPRALETCADTYQSIININNFNNPNKKYYENNSTHINLINAKNDSKKIYNAYEANFLIKRNEFYRINPKPFFIYNLDNSALADNSKDRYDYKLKESLFLKPYKDKLKSLKADFNDLDNKILENIKILIRTNISQMSTVEKFSKLGGYIKNYKRCEADIESAPASFMIQYNFSKKP